MLISINWPSLVTPWVLAQKIYSKMYLVSCTNTHHDVTDLVNYEIVKNTKTWISREWNIIFFLRNKKILNLCLRWQIWRSCRFIAEVTFKGATKQSWVPKPGRAPNRDWSENLLILMLCLNLLNTRSIILFGSLYPGNP